ncbi:MAG: hypothetical protein ACFCUU_19560 [Cyclobacteriaceae bacterium]
MGIQEGTYSRRKARMHLKLQSKKLQSGKCQIKFYVRDADTKKMYGYALVEPEATLKDVVEEIYGELNGVGTPGAYYQKNLYNLAKSEVKPKNMLIFKC